MGTIRLVSKDRHLSVLCQRAVKELDFSDLQLVVDQLHPEQSASVANVWDCEYGEPEPAWIDSPAGARTLFLLTDEQLNPFVSRHPNVISRTLLKPVDCSVLKAILSFFIGRRANWWNVDPNQCSSDVDRPVMLQLLLEFQLRLQRDAQERSVLLAEASHDFRVPLTAISGYTKLLLDDKLGHLTVDQKEVLRRMEYSTKRLSRISNTIFHYALEEFGEYRPEFQQGYIEETIAQAVKEIEPIVLKKEITITLDLEAQEQTMFFEPSQIEEIVANLLENACKATPRGGYIHVTGHRYFWDRRSTRTAMGDLAERRSGPSRMPNAYRISLANSGVKVPPDEMAAILNTNGAIRAPKGPGSGLGIAICRRMVAAHGGSLTVESDREGTRFAVLLPLAPNFGTTEFGKHRSHAATNGAFPA